MTTELQHKESIFGNNSPLTPKTIRKVDTVAAIPEETGSISTSQDLENRLMTLKKDNNAYDPISVFQAEIQLQMVKHLEAIDWKLWEIYNKFVK